MSKEPEPIFYLGPANRWFCSLCKTHGDAAFSPDVTVKDAVAQIRDAHKLASPECPGTTFIRLVNLHDLKAKGLAA
jgi:hypothetical protein